MASIRVERWKQVYSSDPANKYVVSPEHHPYAWLIPRWWYKGSRTVYETCVKIQGSTYQMYVDGFTPAMVFECEVTDDFELKITEARDIRRVVVTTAYAELIDPDGEYLDIEHTLTDSWVVRHNSLPAPIVDVPPVWTADPTYMSGGSSTNNPTVVIGSPLAVRTGEYDGGMPSPTGDALKFRGRWQVRDSSGVLSNGPWTNVGESEIVQIDFLGSEDWWPADYIDTRYQNQIRDFDPEGNARTNNKFTGWKVINEPLTVQTDATLDGSNVYEPGNTLQGTTATFVDGIEPITYQYRWQAGVELFTVETKDGGSFNSPWIPTTNGAATTVGYVVGDVQQYVRLQSQATDATGRIVDSFSDTATITFPTPPITAVGNATLTGTFQVGETVSVATAPNFSGGLEPLTYEFQYQKSSTGTGSSWTGFEGPWAEYDPTVEPQPLLLTEVANGQYIRLQTRARGADGEQLIVSGDVYGPCLPAAAP